MFFKPEKIDGVSFIDKKYNSIEEIIALPQFKNKIVYIDRWYSSCSPCISDFKNYVPNLKKEMATSNIDIEYLYLGKETSIPISKQLWINSIKKYNLKGWHYYFSKEDHNIIFKTLNENLIRKNKPINGYPHYLIAINGKIVDYDAPTPDKIEEIKKLIYK
mgnify:CR=1 FL=1